MNQTCRAVRLARQSPARAIAIAAPFLGRLVGEAAMIAAIGPGRGMAIRNSGIRKLAGSPSGQRHIEFFELDDRHPERHRHDDALEFLLVLRSPTAPAER